MKKYIFLAVTMLLSMVVFAQSEEKKIRKNRVEAGVSYSYGWFGDIISVSAHGANFSFSYERILDDAGKKSIKGIYENDFWAEIGNSGIVTSFFGGDFNFYLDGEGQGVFIGPGLKFGSIGLAENTIGGDTVTAAEPIIGVGANVGYQMQLTVLFGMRFVAEYDYNFYSDASYGQVKAGIGFNFTF